MKKFLYFLEFAAISAGVLFFTLPYHGQIDGLRAITIPNFGQVRSSVSGVPADIESNLGNPSQTETSVCKARHNPIGFPFVRDSSDRCDHGQTYQVGNFLDYLIVLALALIITKLTSLGINRLTKL